MAYKLTLNQGELCALYVIEDRYSHGNNLLCILEDCTDLDSLNAVFYDENFPEEIVFHIPEHKAWEIADLLREETDNFRYSLLPLLSSEYSAKLINFCLEIV